MTSLFCILFFVFTESCLRCCRLKVCSSLSLFSVIYLCSVFLFLPATEFSGCELNACSLFPLLSVIRFCSPFFVFTYDVTSLLWTECVTSFSFCSLLFVFVLCYLSLSLTELPCCQLNVCSLFTLFSVICFSSLSFVFTP